MYCWKCGQENTEGAGSCAYCGAKLERTAPQSEAGVALRMLYDRYGRDAVLSNPLMLANGLGDLVQDCQKLRGQLKMALDAGMGRLYLDQLNDTGAPDAAFDRRVKALLTDDVGFSDKLAVELAGYFDEMIGWRDTIRSEPKTETTQYTPPRAYTPQSWPKREIDHDESYSHQNPGRESKPQSQDGSQEQLRVKVALPQQAVPTAQTQQKENTGIIVLGAIMLLVGTLNYILGKTTGTKLAFAGVLNAEWVAVPMGLFMIFGGIEAKLKKPQKQLFLARSGGNVRCSWNKSQSEFPFCLAVNDHWVDTCISSPYELQNVPDGARITLASINSNGTVCYIDSGFI